MVVIDCPATAETGVIQDRVGRPSMWTVHAPQSARPHPYLVPVNPAASRIAHNRGVSGSTSSLWAAPLIFNFIMAISLLIVCTILPPFAACFCVRPLSARREAMSDKIATAGEFGRDLALTAEKTWADKR